MTAACGGRTAPPPRGGRGTRTGAPPRRGVAPPATAPGLRRTPPRAVADRAPEAQPQGPSGAVVPAIGVEQRVHILSEALPYLQRFRKKTVVIKYGGAAMKDPELKAMVVKDLVLLACVGLDIVLVHGGGPEINKWLGDLGIDAKFHNGRRVTDAGTMDVVEMVLTGRVNKSIVALINEAGGSAVGISGKDANLLRARPTADRALGFVGEVSRVDPSIVHSIVGAGSIPVIATVAADEADFTSLNINADTAAGEIAVALGAEKLILMTDVPGVMEDLDDPATLHRELDPVRTRALLASGAIRGGMIPKIECCMDALDRGVAAAHIIDGRQPHSLLQEILTAQGIGTMFESGLGEGGGGGE